MDNQANFVPGALVRWPSAPGAPLGVIVKDEGSRIRVRFDNDEEVKVFNVRTKNALLSRCFRFDQENLNPSLSLRFPAWLN